MVANERWSLTRGGRKGRFDCIINNSQLMPEITIEGRKFKLIHTSRILFKYMAVVNSYTYNIYWKCERRKFQLHTSRSLLKYMTDVYSYTYNIYWKCSLQQQAILRCRASFPFHQCMKLSKSINFSPF